MTLWVSYDLAQNWSSPRRKTRGTQPLYPDLAIEICLTLLVVFRLALRQTQGFVQSLSKLMGQKFVESDFSTLSRCGKGLKLAQTPRVASIPTTLIVDCAGLKMHGGKHWHEEKHGTKKTRTT